MRLYEKTAAELSGMLRNKECSAVEILADVQERIQETEGEIHAYLTFSESSMQQARAVDQARARGEVLHPLAGIPLAVKDNISTKGLRTTCASRMLEHYIPPFDATVIRKVKDAGMVILGKTNMDEFGMGSSTETSYFCTTHNPHRLDCTAGGSSGGSAAAVASGEATLALGSDTGGSIRQPAAFCGAAGLKPTYGSVSRYGLVAYASSFDQIGTLGRSVTDIALLHSLICGYDPMDATSAYRKYADCATALKPDIRGLRIGIPQEYFNQDISDDVKNSVMTALRQLTALGAELKEISLPGTEYAVSAYYILACAEASSNLARFDGVRYGYRAKEYTGLTDMYERTRSEGFGDEVKRRIMLGTFVLSAGYYDAYYKKAKAAQRRIALEFNEAFKECDIIAAPAAPSGALGLGEALSDRVGMYRNDRCTVPVNLAGLPSLSIPCGRSADGLPHGMQLIGKPFAEQLLLNTAYAYERSTGGFAEVAQQGGAV